MKAARKHQQDQGDCRSLICSNRDTSVARLTYDVQVLGVKESQSDRQHPRNDRNKQAEADD